MMSKIAKDISLSEITLRHQRKFVPNFQACTKMGDSYE